MKRKKNEADEKEKEEEGDKNNKERTRKKTRKWEWKFSSRRIPIDVQIFPFLTIDVNVVREKNDRYRALRNQIFIKFCKHASPTMLKPSLVVSYRRTLPSSPP